MEMSSRHALFVLLAASASLAGLETLLSLNYQRLFCSPLDDKLVEISILPPFAVESGDLQAPN
jgi:hypothetical protein